MFKFTILMIMCIMLQACGIKGDLYMPQEGSQYTIYEQLK